METTNEQQLDMNRIPRHVAIIMDGNGRWAKERGLKRSAGHQAGIETVRRITEDAVKLGVKYLTLYTFSTENWNRPLDEVAALMNLILESLEDEIFIKNNVRFRIIGDSGRLPEAVQKRINECAERTAGNTAMTFIIALSYSSRWELTTAFQRIAREVSAGTIAPQNIDEKMITSFLNTSFMPDPDLLIRTGGELRLSNYLLWQCAYSELYFCDTYWPAFEEKDFRKAIAEYQSRERRFGKTSEQVVVPSK